MAKPGAVIGLNDISFDPTLQTEDIDHDFFDNPSMPPVSPSPPGSPPISSVHQQQQEQQQSSAPSIISPPSLTPQHQIQDLPSNNNNSNKSNSVSSSDNPDPLLLLGLSPRSSFKLKHNAGPINAISINNGSDINNTNSNNGASTFSENGIQATGSNFMINPFHQINGYHEEQQQQQQSQERTTQQMFSTSTLLACLNNPPTTELKIDVSPCDSLSIPKEYYYRNYHYGTASNGMLDNAKTGSTGRHRKKTSSSNNMSNGTASNNNSNNQTNRIKLFDISDSSSEESDGCEEREEDLSDEELYNFMEKYTEFLEPGDSDYSDITEVSPMSSLTASPLPSCFGSLGNGDSSNGPTGENSNSGMGGGGGPSLTVNLFSQKQNNCEENNSSTAAASIHNLQDDQPTEFIPNPITTSVGLSSSPSSSASIMKSPHPHNFSGLFNEAQNGDRSPSNSSCISSSCESTNSANNNTSSISFSLSSATSRSGSSASTCSSSRRISRNHVPRNHTFTPEQLKRIEKENGILLRKILDTQRHGSGHHHFHGTSRGKSGHHRSLQCSASIARQKQLRRIDHENSLLMKRLQSAKPSRLIEESFKSNNNP